MRQQTLDDGVMSELLVADVDRGDSGSYSCFATNSFGTDQTSVVLSVQGKSISKHAWCLSFDLDEIGQTNYFTP